jgi:predicted amidophosphoribosyltransferase
MFDTTYTEVGSLLYRLKSKGDESTVPLIADAAVDCISKKFAAYSIDGLMGVPPSDTNRRVQPVQAIIRELAAHLSKPDYSTMLRKIKETPSLKNISETTKRRELLKDAFKVEKTGLGTILLVDDLFRSGETATAVTNVLRGEGGVKTVLLLTITKTRTRR